MKRRILLVDDELPILLTLKAVLEMNDFDVETAVSAREALKKLDGNAYHMVITDLRMEEATSGYDVIRAARMQAYDPATAILTAYPSEETEWQAHGVQSMLVKPVGTKDLLRQIEALLVTHEDAKQRRTATSAAPPLPKAARGAVRKIG